MREELDDLVGRLTEVEALVRNLRNRVADYPGDRRPPHDAAPDAVPQGKRPPTGDAIDLDALTKWVDQIQQRYASAGDWLRPCWWRHGFVVEELAALRSAWNGVYESDEPPASTAALKWHEDAAKCRERIRRAISTGPGCTAVSHKSDQSITDDPRWTEEQSELRREVSERVVDGTQDAAGNEDPLLPLPPPLDPLENGHTWE